MTGSIEHDDDGYYVVDHLNNERLLLGGPYKTRQEAERLLLAAQPGYRDGETLNEYDLDDLMD